MHFLPAFPLPVVAALVLVAVGALQGVQAQSSCSSDRQSRPVALLERFINADCADCWTDRGTLRAGRGELALDWVLPAAKGDDAPLSVVATRDALKRLEALGMPAPSGSANHRARVVGSAGTLRVAHGLPVSGYIGASIALKPVPRNPSAQPWTAWLALVETIPVGTEGTPVARNLVRNVLQANWDGRKQLSKDERAGFFESRVMDIPAGMNSDRVLLIGWVQDAEGSIVDAAQSRCIKPR